MEGASEKSRNMRPTKRYMPASYGNELIVDRILGTLEIDYGQCSTEAVKMNFDLQQTNETVLQQVDRQKFMCDCIGRSFIYFFTKR
jgi:hypothetical protein